MLTDKDTRMRLSAAYAMAELGADPRQFVPTVTQSLSEPDFESLDFKLEILLRFKEEAKPAIPILKNILSQNPGSTNLTNVLARQNDHAPEIVLLMKNGRDGEI